MEKALACPLTVGNLRVVEMICYRRQGSTKKGQQQITELLHRLRARVQKCLRRPASEWGDVTEEVVNLVQMTERQRDPAHLPYLHWDSTDPGAHSRLEAQLCGHDQGIVQRAADSHTAVIGHHRQEEALSGSEDKEEAHLGSPVQHRNASVLSPKVHQNPRNGDRHVTDFQGGKICREKNTWVSAELGQAKLLLRDYFQLK